MMRDVDVAVLFLVPVADLRMMGVMSGRECQTITYM